MIIWKSDTLENLTEWAESRGLERNGPSENNGEILPVVSPELKLQNNYGYWTQLPTRLPGEHTTLGKLAEGEELGSNLLQVLHRRPRSWAGWARSQGRTQPSPRSWETAIPAPGRLFWQPRSGLVVGRPPASYGYCHLPLTARPLPQLEGGDAEYPLQPQRRDRARIHARRLQNWAKP